MIPDRPPGCGVSMGASESLRIAPHCNGPDTRGSTLPDSLRSSSWIEPGVGPSGRGRNDRATPPAISRRRRSVAADPGPRLSLDERLEALPHLLEHVAVDVAVPADGVADPGPPLPRRQVGDQPD